MQQVLGWSSGHSGMGHVMEKPHLAPPLLVQVALCALLHQGLEVVGVLLHPAEQVVHDVPRPSLLVNPLDGGPHQRNLRPLSGVELSNLDIDVHLVLTMFNVYTYIIIVVS